MDEFLAGMTGFTIGVMFSYAMMIILVWVGECKGRAIAYKEELEKLQSSAKVMK